MQVTFHNIAAGGEGVGRDENGRSVFALYAAPGDVAQVEITEERKNFARGKIVHIESASQQRVVPPCPYYLPKDGDETTACGGCQIQHLAYEAQLQAKWNLVHDALTRVGGFANPPLETCVPSPQTFGYRNKAELVVGEDGKIGFHARRTHKVVNIARCPLLQEPLNELLAAVREVLAATPLDITGFSMRVDKQGTRALQLEGSLASAERKQFVSALREKIPHLIDPNQQLLEESVDDLRFRVAASDFFQVNSALTPRLIEIALEMAAIQKGERALDLFCGSGLFGVFMARAGARVTGVDVRGKLDGNAKLNGLQAQFTKLAADRFLRRAKPPCDVALLDPPRAGAGNCIEPLAALKPSRIVYVSCDPATLARDLKLLTARGYNLTRAVPLDMFPQTAHVETVVKLELV
jgi:23S rRNA (uracil1939-C5)-methyltransferase